MDAGAACTDMAEDRLAEYVVLKYRWEEQPNTVNPNNRDVGRLDRAERGREGSLKIPAGKLPALGLDFYWLYSLFLSLDKDEFDVMFSSTARWTQLHGEALHRRCYNRTVCS